MANNIIVIGGGAAGMMAAITAAEAGAQVTLLERNAKVGRKINITGKGRCNLTNDCSSEVALSQIPRNSRFLYGAFSRFDSHATMDFFQLRGLALKTERGSRVFPQSDRAYDVTDTLRDGLHRAHVSVVHDRALSLLLNEEKGLRGVHGEKRDYLAPRVIIATGGVSYPATGSTGDGYELARTVGHTVIPPRGSLVPLECAEDCCAQMQGLALKNVALTVKNAKKKTVYEDFGEMLFTHFGVSGPMILSASAHMKDYEKNNYQLSIDLKPALDDNKLEERILRDIDAQPNRDFGNLISGLLPRSMVPVILERTGISPQLKANSLTRQQRRCLMEILKHFTLTVIGPRPVEEAIVTAGGVKTGEIDPVTMESKKLPGLYFAGEVMDVDAYTGGFNLQIAWATGHVAGYSAANPSEEKDDEKR